MERCDYCDCFLCPIRVILFLLPKIDLQTSMCSSILAHVFEGKSFRAGIVALGRVFSHLNKVLLEVAVSTCKA